MKKKYIMNGFKFLFDSFKKNSKEYEFEFIFPKSSPYDIITNFLLYQRLNKKGYFNNFDIIHINNWENLLNYRKKKGQIAIAESHGFHIGLNTEKSIKDLSLTKRILSRILSFFIEFNIIKKLKEFDIYYVSTPNMLEYAKKIRKDVKWLPNPIDTEIFNPKVKKIKLRGNPSVFFPTRFHPVKYPEFGFKIFKIIKKEFPDAKLHIINYGQGKDPLFRKYKKIINKYDLYVHNKMSRETLASYYKSSDIVLGQFAMGNNSLVELEAAACGAAVVSYDRYEFIKKEVKELPDFALRLLKDFKYKKKYIKKSLNYVRKVHDAKKVSEINSNNIEKAMKNKANNE